MAAGITIKADKVDELRESLGRYYNEVAKMPSTPELKVDFEVTKPELLAIENVRALSELEPFGTDNQPPVLCFKSAEVVSVLPICAGKHTKLWASLGGDVFEGVFFSKTAEELGFTDGDRVDLAFTPQINEFRGRCSVQLNLIDTAGA